MNENDETAGLPAGNMGAQPKDGGCAAGTGTDTGICEAISGGEPVAARCLMEKLASASYIEAVITKDCSLSPKVTGVEPSLDSFSNSCHLTVCYSCPPPSAGSPDCGLASAEVLGVVFSLPLIRSDRDEIEISGRPVKYGRGAAKADVLAAAADVISFPESNPGDWDVDPDFVIDDDMLRDALEEFLPDDAMFSIDSDGNLCMFEDGDRGHGYVISRQDAIDRFVENRNDIDFEFVD